MQSNAKTVEEYLDSLSPERRDALAALRAVITRNLDRGFEEGIQYGMIGYYVPHRLYPAGYHCDPSQPLPFAGLASHKSHMALYLFGLYASEEDEKWFRTAWTTTGKKLDMGKSCIRFKRLEDVPLEVIGQAIRRMPLKAFLAHYEAATAATGRRAPRKQTPLAAAPGGREAQGGAAKAAGRRAKAASRNVAAAGARRASAQRRPAGKAAAPRVQAKAQAKKAVAKKTAARKTVARKSVGKKTLAKKTAAARLARRTAR